MFFFPPTRPSTINVADNLDWNSLRILGNVNPNTMAENRSWATPYGDALCLLEEIVLISFQDKGTPSYVIHTMNTRLSTNTREI